MQLFLSLTRHHRTLWATGQHAVSFSNAQTWVLYIPDLFYKSGLNTSCWLVMRQPKRCCLCLPLHPVLLLSFPLTLYHTETVTEWAWKRGEDKQKDPQWRPCSDHVAWSQLMRKKTEENTTNRLETMVWFSQQCPDYVSDSSCCSEARARQQIEWQRVMGQQCRNEGLPKWTCPESSLHVFTARTHLMHACHTHTRTHSPCVPVIKQNAHGSWFQHTDIITEVKVRFIQLL